MFLEGIERDQSHKTINKLLKSWCLNLRKI